MATYEPINFKTQRRYYSFVPVVVALLAWGILLFAHFESKSFEVSPEVVQAIAVYQPIEETYAVPVRLVIPKIGVDAYVQSVGVVAGTGEMGVPSNFTDVGWYDAGVRPGMKGNAVIAGHYNGKTVKEAVFFDLETLMVGDEVLIIDADGKEVVLVVVTIKSYNYDEPTDEVFVSNDGKVRLNLITCGGQWLPNEKVYDNRTVVFTEARGTL